MTTLFEASLAVAECLQKPYQGTATGGNATTLVDAARGEPDDLFTNGTIWVLTGNNANKSRKITDWDVTTHTFTFPTMTLLCAAGNIYKCASFEFPLEDIWAAINFAMQDIYRVPLLYSNAAFVTEADKEEYSLPAGIFDIRRVEIATSEDAPYNYQVNYHWRELNGDLMFDTGFVPTTDDLLIRLTYISKPATLDADTDTIDDGIHIERLKWEAAVQCLLWKKERTENPKWTEALNYALAMQNTMQQRYSVPDYPRDPHHSGW